MKKLIIVSFLLFPSVHIYSSHNYPIKFIIKNGTNRTLSVSLEYELDQHYTRTLGTGTPFIPNNTRFHPPSKLTAGQTKMIYVFAFNPCAKQYCNLESNLQKEGFNKHYKVIQGSITVREFDQSYDFKEAVFDGSTITCTIGSDQKLSFIATKQACPLKESIGTNYHSSVVTS